MLQTRRHEAERRLAVREGKGDHVGVQRNILLHTHHPLLRKRLRVAPGPDAAVGEVRGRRAPREERKHRRRAERARTLRSRSTPYLPLRLLLHAPQPALQARPHPSARVRPTHARTARTPVRAATAVAALRDPRASPARKRAAGEHVFVLLVAPAQPLGRHLLCRHHQPEPERPQLRPQHLRVRHERRSLRVRARCGRGRSGGRVRDGVGEAHHDQVRVGRRRDGAAAAFAEQQGVHFCMAQRFRGEAAHVERGCVDAARKVPLRRHLHLRPPRHHVRWLRSRVRRRQLRGRHRQRGARRRQRGGGVVREEGSRGRRVFESLVNDVAARLRPLVDAEVRHRRLPLQAHKARLLLQLALLVAVFVASSDLVAETMQVRAPHGLQPQRAQQLVHPLPRSRRRQRQVVRVLRAAAEEQQKPCGLVRVALDLQDVRGLVLLRQRVVDARDRLRLVRNVRGAVHRFAEEVDNPVPLLLHPHARHDALCFRHAEDASQEAGAAAPQHADVHLLLYHKEVGGQHRPAAPRRPEVDCDPAVGACRVDDHALVSVQPRVLQEPVGLHRFAG
eukprot:Rhum_TRINITY_DN14269_c18_g1::Rhum_TRINITY_DN14269_c18_g1_i1::g.78604::m.78604